MLIYQSAKSSIAQEERLATSLNRWQGSTARDRSEAACTKIDVIILTPETEGSFGVWAVNHSCRLDFVYQEAIDVAHHATVIYLLS